MSEPIFHVEVTLPGIGVDIEMPLNWRVHKRLLTTGISPKALMESAMSGDDLKDLDETKIVKILHIGVTEAGHKVSEDEVWEAVFRVGFYNLATAVGLFLAGLMHGGIQRKWLPKSGDDFLDKTIGQCSEPPTK